jgi:hypothetical protein
MRTPIEIPRRTRRRSVPTSITVPVELLERAREVVSLHEGASLSAYLVELLRIDLALRDRKEAA